MVCEGCFVHLPRTDKVGVTVGIGRAPCHSPPQVVVLCLPRLEKATSGAE